MGKQKRESRYVRYARLAYQVSQKVLPNYRHRNSPHRYTQPQLVACVLLGFYLDVSYRDLEEWLLASDQVCQVLGLSQVPHSSTLCRTFQRQRLSDWERWHQQLLHDLGVEEDAVAIDASGFRPSRASQHYLSRTGRLMRDYCKGFYSVGVSSQYILAWRYARGPGGADAQHLNCLRRRSHAFVRHERGRTAFIVLADKGFDGAQARPTDLIPPRQGQHPVRRSDRRQRLDLIGQARLDGFLGQRWKVETVYSVMKRKSGDALRSCTFARQRREIALKALVYNLHRRPLLLPLNLATKQLQWA